MDLNPISRLRSWRARRSAPSLEEAWRQRRGTGRGRLTAKETLQNSAVWAALRLRSQLVGSMPIDVYTAVSGQQVEVPKPPVLLKPGAMYIGGRPVTANRWLAATQYDLDRSGNAFGLIRAVDGFGLPAQIDLLPLADVEVRVRDGVLKYWSGGIEYAEGEIWHERQYEIPGLAVGLSPVAYAALTLQEYASAQELALDWFSGTALPKAHMRHTSKELQGGDARRAKQLYRAATSDGDVLVTGANWELKPIEAASSAVQWLESRAATVTDIARFFNVPADLIDAGTSGSSLTYANITQRNLQFLIMSLGPAVTARETALSELVPAGRSVKLNRSALLAMDPKTRAETMQIQINSRQRTPDQCRAIDDLPPFSEADMAQFDRLFGARSVQPQATKDGGTPA